MLERICRERWE